ncbi:hypothetical protein Tco_0612178 [Tanacetum coccineum]
MEIVTIVEAALQCDDWLSVFTQLINTTYPLPLDTAYRSSVKNDKVFNNEFNRLSGMDDDLFTYEVEVANILCDSNKDDGSEQRMSHETDDDMGYDPSDVAFN